MTNDNQTIPGRSADPEKAPFKSTLREAEDYSARDAKALRVSLDDINKSIREILWTTADKAFPQQDTPESFKCLTICVVELVNGWTIIGKSAPASPENFDAEKGRTLALDDARRQIWPLLGFALKEHLTETSCLDL